MIERIVTRGKLPSNLTYVVAAAAALSAIVFLTGGLFEHNAYAVGGTVDGDSCAPIFDGTWNDVDTCTITSGIILNSGETLTIPSGVTFVLNSYPDDDILANGATIDVYGTLTVSPNQGVGILATGSTINNHGTINVQNTGDGIGIALTGIFNNYETINISNDGQYKIRSSGTFTNSGTISIQNPSQFGLYHQGTFTNSGTITVNAIGVAVGLYNAFGNTFTNTGTITVQNGDAAVENFGTIDNYGTINVNSGATILNPGTINVFGILNIYSGGILNNDGGTLNVNIGAILNVNSGGTLNVNIGAILNVNSGGTLNVNSGGTLNVNSGGQVMIFCGGIFNNTGGTVTGTITYEVCSPSTATSKLIENIGIQTTDKNVKSSILGPLKEVEKILNDKNPRNDGSACGKLSDFIANVNSKEASGKLSSTLAQQYRDAANAIKQSLGC